MYGTVRSCDKMTDVSFLVNVKQFSDLNALPTKSILKVTYQLLTLQCITLLGTNPVI